MPQPSLFPAAAPVPSDIEQVVATLKKLRLTKAAMKEVQIHEAIWNVLKAAGIVARHEVSGLAPRCRPDFFTEGATVIEVKKKRPNAADTIRQLERYAAIDAVKAIVLVAEMGIPGLPRDIEGKPVEQVALYAAWGITV